MKLYGGKGMEYKIVSAWGNPANPAYDPRTANDGGGYWQFAGGIVAEIGGQLVTVDVDDTSCGEFGSRYYAGIFADGFGWQLVDGSMDDSSIDAAEEIEDILDSASIILGVDAWTLVCEARAAASLCARRAA